MQKETYRGYGLSSVTSGKYQCIEIEDPDGNAVVKAMNPDAARKIIDLLLSPEKIREDSGGGKKKKNRGSWQGKNGQRPRKNHASGRKMQEEPLGDAPIIPRKQKKEQTGKKRQPAVNR